MDLRDLTIETAKALVGITFRVTMPDGRTTPVTVDDVVPFESTSRRRARSRTVVEPRREPFSVYLLGDPTLILPQGMYTLRSDAETIENLFLVPVGQDDQATEYEAVFT
jgi:hypothetical protein